MVSCSSMGTSLTVTDELGSDGPGCLSYGADSRRKRWRKICSGFAKIMTKPYIPGPKASKKAGICKPRKVNAATAKRPGWNTGARQESSGRLALFSRKKPAKQCQKAEKAGFCVSGEQSCEHRKRYIQAWRRSGPCPRKGVKPGGIPETARTCRRAALAFREQGSLPPNSACMCPLVVWHGL